jgi:hypothetical protein
MAITRGQISKQVEGKLRGARDEKEKKRRVKIAIKKKKNPLAKTFTI